MKEKTYREVLKPYKEGELVVIFVDNIPKDKASEIIENCDAELIDLYNNRGLIKFEEKNYKKVHQKLEAWGEFIKHVHRNGIIRLCN